MTWVRIDDSFADHAKVALLSDAAVRLWVCAACWCKKPANVHSRGFVPAAMLEAIAQRSAPLAKLHKLAQELVDAKGGGIFEHGLWEPREGGWQFHDWNTYQPPEDAPAMTRSEAGRVAGKRSAAVRKARFGTAQPPASEPPERPPNDVRDVRPNDVREAVRRTTVERPEPPGPGPVPKRSDAVDPRPDRSEPAPNEPTAALAERARKVLENPFDGQYSAPSKWPEVRRIALAWSQPFGIREPKLRDNVQADRDLKAILEALADGYDPDALAGLGDVAATDDFLRSQRRPGPASFTAPVIRRLLAEPRERREQASDPLAAALAEAGMQ